MRDYSRDTEMVLAFSALLRDLQEELDSQTEAPFGAGKELEQYQFFLSQIVLLQRDLEEYVDQAMTLELSRQDMPVQVLDFSSEWERFE